MTALSAVARVLTAGRVAGATGNDMTLLDNYADVYEVAERLDIHHESVRRLIRQGKIPAVKVFNRRWLVERNALEQYAARYNPLPGHSRDGYLL